MTKRNRPLPSPPGRRFGPGETRPGEASGGLLEEKLAQAAAMGKLEQFMDDEFKDNEHARKLASMMMGMTGMAPATGTAKARPVAEAAEQEKGSVPPPEEIVKAAQAGDVGALMGLLAREHEKRTGKKLEHKQGKQEKGSRKGRAKTARESSPFDRETLNALVSMAKENDVSVDWLVARAIKLYIRDYRDTGRI